MFKSLLGHAKQALADTAERVLGRVAVAILLLVAGGFATAALMIKLVELWGAAAACLAVAALFGLVALVTAAVISVGEQRQEEPQPAMEGEAESETLAGDFTNLLVSDPATLVSAVGTAIGAFRLLGRNASLVLLALIAAAFVWSRSTAPEPPHVTDAPPPAPAE